MPHFSRLRGADLSSVHWRLTRVCSRGMRHRDERMRAAEELLMKGSLEMSSPERVAR